MSSKSVNAGGAATQAGLNYQNRVAAWHCVQILAENETSPLWGLPVGTTQEFLRCETEQPVDDILIGISQDGLIFVNVKHGIRSSTTKNSALDSVIRQFIRQFISYRGLENGPSPWTRALDPAKDRLVLVTRSKTTSSAIRESLPKVLQRIQAGEVANDLTKFTEVLPQAENRVFKTFRSLFSQAWLDLIGVEISFEDELDLLKLVRINILDVDENEISEREAKNLLRTSVLKNPDDADLVWNLLIQLSANLASRRGGADRASLQKHLLDNGVSLKIPASFRSDTEKLQLHSQQTLTLLKELSSIRVGELNVKINRPSTRSLLEAAEENSIVVVGTPGAGKSGAMYDIADTLLQQDRDVIFFAVDGLNASSLGNLRNELGLEHDLVTTIKNWPGGRPAFLIIDALDAARSESSAKTFYELISLTLGNSKRWRVITSIRQFDLRHNRKLRQLFSGRPPTGFAESEFYDVRHFSVPLLDQDELLQIRGQSPELYDLTVKAELPFQKLLEVPFNLRLAGELIGAGVSISSLTPIKSQIALLDLFWEERIVGIDDDGYSRQALLLRILNTMVEARTLRISQSRVIVDGNSSRALRQLLSSHILSEGEGQSASFANAVTFAHHVLFDYAVSRLMFRGDHNALLKSLEENPDLVLSIRPSIVLYFQHLWVVDKGEFWKIYFDLIASDGLPEIGKIIGASVVVEFDYEVSDFSPLVSGLSNPDENQRNVAIKAFRHIIGAFLVMGTSSISRLIGSYAPPLCELLDKCTTHLDIELAYSIRPILWTLCRNPSFITAQQRGYLGAIARRLLSFAIKWEPRDSNMVLVGIETVCKTFESDPETSKRILEQCLEPGHVQMFGHEELTRMAEEAERLVPLAPDLVEQMYTAAFTNYDYSDEKTNVLGSRILPLTSTRQQDFNMARYSFVQKFEIFLNHAPLNATRVLLLAINDYIETRNENLISRFSQQTSGKSVFESEKFIFNGREVSIKRDHSSIWEDGVRSQNDDALKMLDRFSLYLEKLSEDTSNSKLRSQIVALIAADNENAVFWKKLIEIGAKHPETLGYEIRDLTHALPVLITLDTTTAIGDLLLVIFDKLSREERILVERTILGLFNTSSKEERRSRKRIRDRLLGCLNYDLIVTDEARKVLDKLKRLDAIPPNNPLFGHSQMTWGSYTDEDFLTERGVSLDEEQNRRLYELWQPAKTFAATYGNDKPAKEEVLAIIPQLRALFTFLSQDENEQIQQSQRDMAWLYLADACSSIAKLEDWSIGDEHIEFVRTVLLACASYPDPVAMDEDDNFFDEHPSWSPAARIEAAAGLTELARHKECVNDEVLTKIETLILHDPVTAVRFQAAPRIVNLYYTAPELMWRILEVISNNETRNGILKFLIPGPLRSLAAYHPDEIVKISKRIFERVGEDTESAKDVRGKCASIFLGLYLWQNHEASGQLVRRIVDNPNDYNPEAHKLAFDLRDSLNVGLDELSNEQKEKVRKKAFRLIEDLLSASRAETDVVEARNRNIQFDSWSEQDQRLGRNLAHLADSIGNQIYFASGAYANSQIERNNEDQIPMNSEARKSFFNESKKSLGLLSAFGYASLTHHLLQTLEFFIPYDPKYVFVLVAKVVNSGMQSGYQYESMAADLVVKMVERFIAEFRFIFQDDEECRRLLIDVLDIFVTAGWASARQLTYRLEDIFR
jgi:hypothetical protein